MRRFQNPRVEAQSHPRLGRLPFRSFSSSISARGQSEAHRPENTADRRCSKRRPLTTSEEIENDDEDEDENDCGDNQSTISTGVRKSTLLKKISAIFPGIRIHPCDAG
jgi:hypothetical protein